MPSADMVLKCLQNLTNYKQNNIYVCLPEGRVVLTLRQNLTKDSKINISGELLYLSREGCHLVVSQRSLASWVPREPPGCLLGASPAAWTPEPGAVISKK